MEFMLTIASSTAYPIAIIASSALSDASSDALRIVADCLSAASAVAIYLGVAVNRMYSYSVSAVAYAYDRLMLALSQMLSALFVCALWKGSVM